MRNHCNQGIVLFRLSSKYHIEKISFQKNRTKYQDLILKDNAET
jgi:hypothetical protein